MNYRTEADLPESFRRQLESNGARVHRRADLDPTQPSHPQRRSQPERDLVQQPTLDYARMNGVTYWHIPTVKLHRGEGRHLTMIDGPAGFPDAVFAFDGRSGFLEFKHGNNKPTDNQMTALRVTGGLWTNTADGGIYFVDCLIENKPCQHDPDTLQIIVPDDWAPLATTRNKNR